MAFGIESVVVALEGLRQSLDSFSDKIVSKLGHEGSKTRAEVAGLRSELTDLRTVIDGWRAHAGKQRPAVEEAARAPAESTPQQQGAGQPITDDPAGADRRERHDRLLLTAAGISSARLTCHRDLWAWLVERAADAHHFRIPGKVNDHDDNVTVTLSGPTVLAALITLWGVRRDNRAEEATKADWALAHELYEALAAAAESVSKAPRGSDGDAVAITIDRRPGHGHDEVGDPSKQPSPGYPDSTDGPDIATG